MLSHLLSILTFALKIGIEILNNILKFHNSRDRVFFLSFLLKSKHNIDSKFENYLSLTKDYFPG